MPKPGFLTASSFPDLMVKGKGGQEFGKTAMRHVEQLALDMLGFSREEGPKADSLDWGREQEDNAAFYYEERTLRELRRAPFQVSPDLPYVGGTIDRLAGDAGGVEIKCPKDSKKHVFHADRHYTGYVYQIQGYMWIYSLKWIDFVSYDPRSTDERLQLRIKRVEPDAGIIAALETRCKAAYAEALKLAGSITAQRPSRGGE